jgi:hypothetical protein
MSTSSRPAWAPVLEQIERALGDWLQRTSVPPTSSPVADSLPLPTNETATFEQRLARIEAALENAGRQSRETDAALEEAAAQLSRWRERAATLLLPAPPPR